MSEMLELDYDMQPLSEYALTTWTRMTDEGVAPLDSLALIEAQLQRRQCLRPSRDSEQALRLVGKWRALVGQARAKLH
ncbi:MAG: hypothetical protein P0Y65_14355 [Candidatus Devosia phytovorans]|uniref:Uncharacterized protein n=1 Tax=Candidatus Devosia phytovorans TaxID=3121372 RepID=A0AAJ5VSL0_9HYPH|nr:hypothetical protein [Devosia sp.]WEK03370.1 MAG: hypothetical protein P0Y65_14355 [Devosia sp.]